jgi:hypothetical protein
VLAAPLQRIGAMFWFRTFALGFSSALLALLIAPRHSRECALVPPQAVSASAASPGASPRPAAPGVTVVDVAPGVSGDMLAQMVVLAANEHIIAVDDVPVTSGIAALATHALGPNQYIDVSIGSDTGTTRRVLVLLR